jgi:salicylate hydroxylase
MGSVGEEGQWRPLDVAVVGGGIGGFCAAIALRRAGHKVTVYERNDFAGEVGASISCAANGTRWLHEWDVDVAKGDPVVLQKLINRDWYTGEPVSVYDLADYEQRWGYVYNMFHRRDMHTMLKDTSLQEDGEGTPVVLLVNHAVRLFFSSFLSTIFRYPPLKLLKSAQSSAAQSTYPQAQSLLETAS